MVSDKASSLILSQVVSLLMISSGPFNLASSRVFFFFFFFFGGWPHALLKVLVLWKESGGSKPGGVSHESPTSFLIQGTLLSLADMLHTGTHRPCPSG